MFKRIHCISWFWWLGTRQSDWLGEWFFPAVFDHLGSQRSSVQNVLPVWELGKPVAFLMKLIMKPLVYRSLTTDFSRSPWELDTALGVWVSWQTVSSTEPPSLSPPLRISTENKWFRQYELEQVSLSSRSTSDSWVISTHVDSLHKK